MQIQQLEQLSKKPSIVKTYFPMSKIEAKLSKTASDKDDHNVSFGSRRSSLKLSEMSK